MWAGPQALRVVQTLQLDDELGRVQSSMRKWVGDCVSLSTEPVDNSVDCSSPQGPPSLLHCIFITLVKK
jgi:hypothetical protein